MTSAGGSKAIQLSSQKRDGNEIAPMRFADRTGACVPPLCEKVKDNMKVRHSSLRDQTFGLFEWAANNDLCAADHRVRWVVRRCRVSRATAETIIANAGLSDG